MSTYIRPAATASLGVGLRYKGLRWALYSMALLTAGAALLPPQSAAAFDDRFGESPDQDRAFNARRSGNVATLDSVISRARLKGKLLDAQLKGGRYVIKLLGENGRITTVELDASVSSGGRVGAADSRSGGDVGSRGGGGGPGGGGSGGGGGGGGPGGGGAPGGGGSGRR